MQLGSRLTRLDFKGLALTSVILVLLQMIPHVPEVICAIISIIEGCVLMVVKVLVECKVPCALRELKIVLNPRVYLTFRFKRVLL
jgi:hypothetical protein